MDWEKGENESKNLWERNGRRGGLTENQGRKSRRDTKKESGVLRHSAGGRRYREKQPKGKRKSEGPDALRISLIGLVAVAAYIVVAVYLGGHFYSGAQIYGIDCSRMTAGQVKEEVQKKLGEYTLTVEERNGQKDVITASQIGLQYQDDSSIENHLKSQRCYIWPAMMLLGKGGNLAVTTTYAVSYTHLTLPTN